MREWWGGERVEGAVEKVRRGGRRRREGKRGRGEGKGSF